MKYEKPFAERIQYEAEDIITASDTCRGKSNNKNSGKGMGCKGSGGSKSDSKDNGTRNN